jgi:hypothetical protein
MRQAHSRFFNKFIRTIERSANDVTGLDTRQLLFGAGAVLMGAAAWFAWYWVTIGRYIESTDDAYVSGEITTLSLRSRVSSRPSPSSTTGPSRLVTCCLWRTERTCQRSLSAPGIDMQPTPVG